MLISFAIVYIHNHRATVHFFFISRSETHCFQNICTENYTNTLSSVAFFVYYHFVRFNYYARQGNFNIYLVSSVVSFPSGFGVASFVWAQTRYRRRGEFTFWQMPPLLSLIWYNRKARIPAAVRKRQKSNSFAFASFTQF